MKKIYYPELVAEMAKKGESQTSLAKLLEMSRPAMSNRLAGKTEWTISEIDKLCEYFDKDYYTLFKKESK